MSLSIAQGFQPKPIAFKGDLPAKSKENLAFKSLDVGKLPEEVLTPKIVDEFSKLNPEKQDTFIEKLSQQAKKLPDKARKLLENIITALTKLKNGEITKEELGKELTKMFKESGVKGVGCMVAALLFLPGAASLSLPLAIIFAAGFVMTIVGAAIHLSSDDVDNEKEKKDQASNGGMWMLRGLA